METLSRYQRDIDAQVNDLATKPGRLWNSDVEPANSSIARQRVTNLAGTFVRLGLKPAEAVKQAAAAVKRTSVTYNGVLLNLQGFDVPENFAESVDAAVADFAAKSPRMIERNGVDVSDIAIAPASSGDASGGRFVLIDRDTMLPLLDDNGRAAYISLEQLRRDARIRKEAKDWEAVRNRVLRDSIAAKSLVQAVDTDGKTYWVDKNTREIYTYSFGQKDTAPRWSKTGRRYKRGILTTPQGGPVFGGKVTLEVGRAVDRTEDAARWGIQHHPLRYLRDGAQSGWDAVKDGYVQIGPIEIGNKPAPSK